MENNASKELSVLIVEDNDMFLNLAAEMLQGHKVATAKTGNDGINKFKYNNPDITFLDIGLPDKDGHAVLAEILAINKNAFVIMLTSSNLKKDVEASFQKGAKGYIIKPFSRKKIKDSIDNYIKFKDKK